MIFRLIPKDKLLDKELKISVFRLGQSLIQILFLYLSQKHIFEIYLLMRIIRRIITCLLLLQIAQILSAQSSHEVDFIKKLPAFTMYGDNYLVTGTSLNKNSFSPETSDVKFQIGFKQRLTNVPLPWGIFPILSYRQKSFWSIFRESAPFRETNYNPAIGFAKLFVDENGLTDGFLFALEHESNGRDGLSSRSWNFFSLTYLKPFGKKWQVQTKLWLPVGGQYGNEDIESYRGYGSLSVSYRPIQNAFIDLHLQPAFSDKLTGFVKLALSFKIAKERNQFLYLEYFGGYAEDLINYNQMNSNLRIGIVFKDLFANFQ